MILVSHESVVVLAKFELVDTEEYPNGLTPARLHLSACTLVNQLAIDDDKAHRGTRRAAASTSLSVAIWPLYYLSTEGTKLLAYMQRIPLSTIYNGAIQLGVALPSTDSSRRYRPSNHK